MGRRALFEKFISGLKTSSSDIENDFDFNLIKYKFNNSKLDLTDMLSVLGSTGLNINALHQNMLSRLELFYGNLDFTLLVKLFGSKLFSFYLKIILEFNIKTLQNLCKSSIVQYRLLCLGDRLNFCSVVKMLLQR